MNDETPTDRPVELQTDEYRVRGALRINPVLRTLDELNVVSRFFVTLQSPAVESAELTLEDGPLSVASGSILFLHELGSPPLRHGSDFGRFTKAPVRLRLGRFDVQGFVHIPPGGTPVKRFEHHQHAFVALTSALVSGPSGEFTVPFLAVNRSYVAFAQHVAKGTDVESSSIVGEELTRP